MSPEQIAAGAVVLSFASLVVSGWQRRNRVSAGLRTELDQALAENARLVAENATQAEALHHAKSRVSPELLAGYVKDAIAYANQLGGTSSQKKLHAVGYVRLRDETDNGRRDWPDALIGTAIEAELGKLTT